MGGSISIQYQIILTPLIWIYYAPVQGSKGLRKAGETQAAEAVGQAAKQPGAVAIWAKVSDEVETRLKEAGGNVRLKLSDWRSGTKPYLIDVIAPFGGRDEVIAEWKKVIGGVGG